ncbi:MAG TPA: DNA polymerase III subunit epsilon [Microvirga sp.]|nr:DNA polymerase III subunit epsilon [Microvirga sp.]
MLREIVLDTETTGTDPKSGDRVVEIGCVELLNHIPTGRTYHVYLNPERAMSAGALAVHGLSDEFLKDKPVFSAVAEEFVAFLSGGRLVIHNAAFDVGFLNAEFARTGHPAIALGSVVDTLALARRKHPGASNSLDALCSRYGIDNSRRTKHGALLDAEILAEVYIELIGGKQADLGLSVGPRAAVVQAQAAMRESRNRPIVSRLTDAERQAHEAFIRTLKGEVLWLDYLGASDEAA